MIRGLFRDWSVRLLILWFLWWGAVAAGAERETPQRLISLAPSLTGMVQELGLGERLVGVSMHCPALASGQSVPSVGRMDLPDYETILSLRPDLVLATSLTPVETLDRLQALGVPTERFAHDGLEGILEDLERLGTVLGADEGGHQLVAELRHRRARVAEAVDALESRRPRVLLLYSLDGRFSAGKGTFPGDMIEAAGGSNLAAVAASPWPQLEKEAIVKADPEVLFLSKDGCLPSGESPEAVIEVLRSDGFWRHLTAVKTGRIHFFQGTVLSVPGVDSFLALEQMHAELHGERGTADGY